ncbi:hypothetical protein FOCC_FOCC006621 [Frankliniella occidentalis]|nr:hypothetical protein FOCC_FOCC006621 [Frankliniella occidentalis]
MLEVLGADPDCCTSILREFGARLEHLNIVGIHRGLQVFLSSLRHVPALRRLRLSFESYNDWCEGNEIVVVGEGKDDDVNSENEEDESEDADEDDDEDEDDDVFGADSSDYDDDSDFKTERCEPHPSFFQVLRSLLRPHEATLNHLKLESPQLLPLLDGFGSGLQRLTLTLDDDHHLKQGLQQMSAMKHLTLFLDLEDDWAGYRVAALLKSCPGPLERLELRRCTDDGAVRILGEVGLTRLQHLVLSFHWSVVGSLSLGEAVGVALTGLPNLRSFRLLGPEKPTLILSRLSAAAIPKLAVIVFTDNIGIYSLPVTDYSGFRGDDSDTGSEDDDEDDAIFVSMGGGDVERKDGNVEAQVDDVQGHVGDVRGREDDAVQGHVTDVQEGQVNDVQGKVDDFQDDMGESHCEVDEAHGEVDDSKGEVDDIPGEVDDFEGRVGDFKCEVEDVKGEVDDVKGKEDDAKGGDNSVKDEDGDVKRKHGNNEVHVDDVEGQVHDAEGQVVGVQGQDNDAEGQDNDAEGQDNDAEGQVVGVQGQGNDVQGEVVGVHGQVNDVQGEVGEWDDVDEDQDEEDDDDTSDADSSDSYDYDEEEQEEQRATLHHLRLASPQLLPLLDSFASALQRLTLTVDDDHHLKGLQQMTSLKHLTIFLKSDIFCYRVSALLKSCPSSLERLELRRCSDGSVRALGAVGVGLTSLQHLVLSCRRGRSVMAGSLRVALVGLPNLRSLRLLGLDKPTLKLSHLSADTMPKLAVIVFTDGTGSGSDSASDYSGYQDCQDLVRRAAPMPLHVVAVFRVERDRHMMFFGHPAGELCSVCAEAEAASSFRVLKNRPFERVQVEKCIKQNANV